MEINQQKPNFEKFQTKSKIKELIDETNEIFESKIKRINSIVNSMKIEHNRLLLKSKIKIF